MAERKIIPEGITGYLREEGYASWSKIYRQAKKMEDQLKELAFLYEDERKSNVAMAGALNIANAELVRLREDVADWLSLDDSITQRLEMPHGWTDEAVMAHRRDLDDRDLLKQSLRTRYMQPVKPIGDPNG